MLKVVIDANQWISAVITPQGNSAKIIDLFRRQLIGVAISEEILEEINQVLEYPKIQKRHGWDSREISLFLSEVTQFCAFVNPPRHKTPIFKKDPSDDKFLDCALASDADYIVTGDKDLLEMGQYEGVRIVSPKVFLEFEGF